MGSRTGCKRGKNDMKQRNYYSHNGKRSKVYSHLLEDDKGKFEGKCSDLWQQWHYDYGTFTVFTTPMFIRPNDTADDAENSCVKFTGLECPPPSGNTYLQILHPLKNVLCDVKAPPESFILQVGECADILSGRKLQSTLHSVTRPSDFHDLSRETFVVFLHPAWDKVFRVSDYPTDQSASTCQNEEDGERPRDDEQELKKLTQEIFNLIPPLLSRFRDGMTFSEFSRETTRQYYGGNGLQSK